MDYDTFQVAVKALCFDNLGKLLLIKSDSGEWDLPGGRINYGENLLEALQRECQEELGVDCVVLEPTPSVVWTAQNKNGAWRIDLGYKVSFPDMNFSASNENAENGFFNSLDARKLNLSPHLNKLNAIFK